MRLIVFILVIGIILLGTRWITKNFWRRVSRHNHWTTVPLIIAMLAGTLFLPGIIILYLNTWVFAQSTSPFIVFAPMFVWAGVTLALSLYYKAKYGGYRKFDASSVGGFRRGERRSDELGG